MEGEEGEAKILSRCATCCFCLVQLPPSKNIYKNVSTDIFYNCTFSVSLNVIIILLAEVHSGYLDRLDLASLELSLLYRSLLLSVEPTPAVRIPVCTFEILLTGAYL